MTRFSPIVRNLSTHDNLISQFLPNSRIINKFSLNSHKILTKFHKLLQILTKFSPNSTSSSKFLQILIQLSKLSMTSDEVAYQGILNNVYYVSFLSTSLILLCVVGTLGELVNLRIWLLIFLPKHKNWVGLTVVTVLQLKVLCNC